MSANIKAYMLARNIVFSHEEKKACLEIAGQLADIAVKAKSHGLLAVEDDIHLYENLFLQTAVQLMMDVCTKEDHGELRELLEDYIIFDNSTGKELLERILILEGVVKILDGTGSKILENRLGVYFGLNFSKEYKEYFNSRKSK